MALVTSVLTGGSNNHETTSEEVNAYATDFVNEGIVGDIANTNGVAPATGGFAVNAQGSPDMSVAVSAGVAYVTATPTSQSSQVLRVRNTASDDVTISANSSGSTKYDWIYIVLSATAAANPNSAADDVATLEVSRSSSASADDGSPPTYGYPIAVVTVANGETAITNSMIRDIREKVILETGATSDVTGWSALGFTPDTVTYNGNRSYDLVFNNTDLTDTLSPGMRLRTTRTVTAPTQCTDLESGSSQYYSKTTPAGMTFTNNFVVSAWIKLESYTGSSQTIASRYNGTSGWIFNLQASGVVRLAGYNAGSGNVSYVESYQSIPLNKWVHVSAQLDMSAFTATTTTSYVMLDGINVPAAVTRGGTNPTALVQAGNLDIGSFNGGTSLFDGKICQVAIYSAKVTQANIRATISQGLTGSETSLVSAYSLNNSLNDLSANANNLTAQNSAVATNADSPFALGADLASGYTDGTTDFGIVMATSFSTNTTVTVQVPEGCTIPTSGGVSGVLYSTQDVPYGFPRAKGLWRISTGMRQTSPTTSNATFGAFQSGNYKITVPTGDWRVGHRGLYTNASTTTVSFNLSSASLTGLTVTEGRDVSPLVISVKASAASNTTFCGDVSEDYSHSTATTYTMQTVGATTSAAVDGLASGQNELYAECAYV